jgi:hypothetical protein
MIRATVPFVLLLALTGPATAQQAAERSHIVTSGETLSGIAALYYGSASEWQRIFEANRDVLSDPDVLSTGVTLVIPEVGAGPGTAQVTGVGVGGFAVPAQDLLSYQARRELLTSRPFEPMGVPQVSESERTVFFGVPDPGDRANVIVLEAPEVIPAFPPSFFYAGSWIVPAGDRTDQVGAVIAVVGGGADDVEPSAQLYAEVLLAWSGSSLPLVGEEVLSYRMGREIEGVGELAIPTGRLVVTRVGEGEVVAEVIQAFGWLRAGDLVAEGRVFPLEPGVHPTAQGGGMEGRIVAFQDERDVHVPGDMGFVDLGSVDGLAVGDVLVGVGEPPADWTGRALASFQVVGLGEETATIRILSNVSPSDVRPGLRVVVNQKMP